MIDFITALWFGFLGACVGSFLNVVAYRMPLGLSVVWQPSHCPRCKHPIRPHDNVPILGWLWLRGRCRDCRAPIAPRYALVETIVGALFFLLAYVEVFSGGANLPAGPITELRGAWQTVWNPHWPLLTGYAVHALLTALLVAVTLFDLDDALTPRRFVAIAALLLAAAVAFGAAPWKTLPALDESVAPWLAALTSAAIGATPGALAAILAQSTAKRIGPAVTRNLANAGVALALAGAALGLRAALTIAAAALVTAVLLGLPRVGTRPIAGWLTAATTLAALASLVLLERACELLP